MAARRVPVRLVLDDTYAGTMRCAIRAIDKAIAEGWLDLKPPHRGRMGDDE